MSKLVKIHLNALQARHTAAKQAVKRARTLARRADTQLDCWYEAQSVLQLVATEVQANAHRRIAEVVSRCLSLVFDEPYTFNINFERSRGRTQAILTLERNGLELDAMGGVGGGVVDVAGFALRLACLMLARPQVRRLLVLDEPFKHLSREYRPRARTMLTTLAEEMGVQVIMVTHDKALMCGKIVQL